MRSADTLRRIPVALTRTRRKDVDGNRNLEESKTRVWCHRETGGIMASVCTHLNQIKNVKPSAKGCEDCLKMGDTWVHLRMCLECGHVGCCDSSKNKHATKHFHGTKHPIMRSIELGESWKWCYVD